MASRARVHRSTVSLALRDDPRLPEATRKRIRAVASALGYRPNPLVAALMRTRRSGRNVKHVPLAFVTSYPTRHGWRPQHHDRPDFYPGAVARAREFGYKLEHFWLAQPGMTPGRFSRILTARGIHGLIIGRLPPGRDSLQLVWEQFSCVALGLTLRSPLLHHVTENHFDTVCQAMQRCLERGYRRVGFAFTEANDSPRVGDRWLAAYLLQQRAFPVRDRLTLCPGVPTDASSFGSWFRRERPDALLVSHSRPAVAWLEAAGKQVPRDVGLVELEEHPEFGSAGVYYDPAQIGALAVDMLIGLMHRNQRGVPTHAHEVLLTGEWRDGPALPHCNESGDAPSARKRPTMRRR